MPKIFDRSFWADVISNRVEQVKSGDIELFLRIFNEYFYRFRTTFFFIILLILISAASAAAPVWLIKGIINNIFINKESYWVFPLFLLIVGVFVVKGASTYMQTVLSSQISNAMVADVQKRMYAHILEQRILFFDKKSSDELTMRFNQGAQGFNSILTTVLVAGARDTATLTFFLATMLYLDPVLTLLTFTVAPLVFIGVNILMKKLKDIIKEELEGFAILNKYVRETVQGISVVKSFNLEMPLKSQMQDVIVGLEERKNKIARLQAAPVPLLDTLGGVAVGLAILYAGSRTVTGTYDSQNFVAFALALILAAEHGRRISQLPVKLKSALVAVNMVFSLLNDNKAEKSGTEKLDIQELESQNKMNGASVQPLIQFENVGFSYNNTTPVLSGFSLDVNPGEMVALVGPSGAGKSTVLKLLLKLYEANEGRILINGLDQKDINLTSLRDSMSFVGQSNFIFTGSIKDNLTLRNDDIEQSVIENACKQVGMHDYIMNMPQQYNTSVGELGSMISGGQAQRLNMARAIIKDAPILLLDEVTSALDADNEQLIKDYVQSQIGRKTIFVIAHRLSTIKDATKIALVDKGQVVDVAPHEQLLATNDYYERIVALQFTQ